jgi:hypothetical protein
MHLRRRKRGVHRIRVAGVKARGDVSRTDELEQLCIMSRAFAEIRIDIDG